MNDERPGVELLERVAEAASFESPAKAPARLKSRIYSSLVRRQRRLGPLRSLALSDSPLCVFENLVATLPVGEAAKQRNPCSVCHARILAERLEHAPIYWSHCPYVEFQKH
jgi:hypothetical protein